MNELKNDGKYELMAVSTDDYHATFYHLVDAIPLKYRREVLDQVSGPIDRQDVYNLGKWMDSNDALNKDIEQAMKKHKERLIVNADRYHKAVTKDSGFLLAVAGVFVVLFAIIGLVSVFT